MNVSFFGIFLFSFSFEFWFGWRESHPRLYVVRWRRNVLRSYDLSPVLPAPPPAAGPPTPNLNSPVLAKSIKVNCVQEGTDTATLSF